MINYTKKWWLLGCLRRAIAIHTKRSSLEVISAGQKVVLSQQFFISGNSKEIGDHWNGLANKFTGRGYDRYARFRFSWFLFWQREYSDDKLKQKTHEYNEIFEICRKEGYIEMDLVPDGSLRPSVTNIKANRIRGFPIGYFHGLLWEYDKFWIAIGGIIGAVLTFIAGLGLGK